MTNELCNRENLGIIAGKGAYPFELVNAVRKKSPQTRIIVVAFHGETDPELAKEVEVMEFFRVGQLGKLIRFFASYDVKEAMMVGQITPKHLFDLRPDIRLLLMLAKIKKRNAESLFGGIADELQKDGIHLLSAVTFLEDHLPEEGLVFGANFKKRQLEDAHYGFGIAKQMSALDIGQSVAVRHGTVLAVEAFEGTNECIRRGGELGKGKDVMIIKVSKPNQDLRFDVPVIGPDTIKNCSQAGVSSVVIEAGKTLILNWNTMQQLCEELKISVYAIGNQQEQNPL